MTSRTDTAWCPECRTRQPITDVHAEGHYEAQGEVGYTVTDLACGHDLQTTPVRVGPGPGEPYAGDRPTARDTSPRELDAVGRRMAQAAADLHDPWGAEA